MAMLHLQLSCDTWMRRVPAGQQQQRLQGWQLDLAQLLLTISRQQLLTVP
jgi:hypothetical protein